MADTRSRSASCAYAKRMRAIEAGPKDDSTAIDKTLAKERLSPRPQSAIRLNATYGTEYIIDRGKLNRASIGMISSACAT